MGANGLGQALNRAKQSVMDKARTQQGFDQSANAPIPGLTTPGMPLQQPTGFQPPGGIPGLPTGAPPGFSGIPQGPGFGGIPQQQPGGLLALLQSNPNIARFMGGR